jgi:hypothetical protein
MSKVTIADGQQKGARHVLEGLSIIWIILKVQECLDTRHAIETCDDNKSNSVMTTECVQMELTLPTANFPGILLQGYL